eukprot:839352_1
MTAIEEVYSFIKKDIVYNKYFWKWSIFYSGCWVGYGAFVNNIYLPHSSRSKRAKATNRLLSLTHALLATTSAWYYSIKYNHGETEWDIISTHQFPSNSVLEC